MREVLTENGFFMYHKCHCGGLLTEEFKSEQYPKLEVKTNPTRAFFRILRAGRQIDQGQSMNLKEKLNTAIAQLKAGVVPL